MYCDKHGNLVTIEILNAQERVANPQIVEDSVIYQMPKREKAQLQKTPN